MAAAHGMESVAAAAHLFRDTSRAIYTGLQTHFNDSRLSDIVLVRPDGRAIYAHQVILTACSRKFAAVLGRGDASGKELPIQGVDSSALESVVSYFYRGECLLSPITVVPIYDVCLKLEVPGLSAGCEQYLQQNLNPQTCPIFLEASYQLMLEHVVKMCLEYAQIRFDDIVATSTFHSLSADTMRLLLTHTRSSTGDVAMVRALARWAVRRPEQLAECEAMFKELNITATALLQLLQSPDFVQTLQQGHEAGTAAQREEGAGIVAGMAELGGGAAGVGGPGRMLAACGNAVASSSTDAGGGSRLPPGNGAASRPLTLRLRDQHGAVETGGGAAAAPAARMLLSFGPSTGQHKPSTASSGARNVDGGDGDDDGGRIDTHAGRPLPPAVPTGTAEPRDPHAAGGDKRAALALPNEPTATEGAATGPSGSSGRPPPPSQQQQPSFKRRSYQQQQEDAVGPRVEGSLPGRDVPARARLSAYEDGRGGGLGFIALANGGDDAEVRREVNAIRCTGTPTRSPHRLVSEAEAEADALQPGLPLVQQEEDGAGGGMLAVPVTSLKLAGLEVHLLSSGAFAVSGGALGSQQVPLQLLPAGPGSKGPLLALLPMALLPQLQQPPPATGGAVQQDASPRLGLSAAAAAGAAATAQLTRWEPGLWPLGPAATKAVAAQQRPSRIPAPPQGSRGGGGRIDAAAGGGSRVQMLLDAAADSCDGSSVAARQQDQLDLKAPGIQMKMSGPGGLRLQSTIRSAASAVPLDTPASLGLGSAGGPGAGSTPVVGGPPANVLVEAPAVGAAAAQATAGPPKQLRSAAALGASGLQPVPVAGGEPPGAATTASAAGGVGPGAHGLPRGRAAPVLQPPIGGSSADAREPVAARWSLPGSGAAAPLATSMQLPDAGGPGRATSLPMDANPLLTSGGAALGVGLSLGQGAGGGLVSGSGGANAAGKRRRASPADDDPDHVEEGVSGRAAGSGRSGKPNYGGRFGFGVDGGTSSTPGAQSNRPTLMCHVDDCHMDLSCLKEYHQRFRICDFHLKAEVVMREGIPQRFCQQCGRFHVLTEFDGTKRSCRARLQRHNARRRKRPEKRGSGGDGASDESRKPRPVTWGGSAQRPPPVRTVSHQQLQHHHQQQPWTPLQTRLLQQRSGMGDLSNPEAGAGAGDEPDFDPEQDPEEDTQVDDAAAAADSLQQLQLELLRLQQEGQNHQLQQELQQLRLQQRPQQQQASAGLGEPQLLPRGALQAGTALDSKDLADPLIARRQEPLQRQQQQLASRMPQGGDLHVPRQEGSQQLFLEQQQQRGEEAEIGERPAGDEGGVMAADGGRAGAGGKGGAVKEAGASGAAQHQSAGADRDSPMEQQKRHNLDIVRVPPLGSLKSGNTSGSSDIGGGGEESKS